MILAPDDSLAKRCRNFTAPSRAAISSIFQWIMGKNPNLAESRKKRSVEIRRA
jgi:hypothetical protein